MNFRQVHLDFHTSEKIENIGAEFNREQFQEALIEGHVNSITVFAKCHHGYAYHPSKVNKMHPNLSFDLLGEQVLAAHEIGVKTPIYLSAGLDERIIMEHPEWMADDKMHTLTEMTGFSMACFHMCCMNTPYLDYLCAEIKEVLENYPADGIFLDIIGMRPCYCSSCLKQMFSEGIDPTDDAQVLELGERTYKKFDSISHVGLPFGCQGLGSIYRLV